METWIKHGFIDGAADFNSCHFNISIDANGVQGFLTYYSPMQFFFERRPRLPQVRDFRSSHLTLISEEQLL